AAKYPPDLGKFVHQPGLVLEPPGRIDDQRVRADRCALFDSFENEACRIAALVPRDDRHADAIGPNLELPDRGSAEGITRDEHHIIILLLQQMSYFRDCSSFPRSVDTDHQNNLRAGEGLDLQRLRHRCKDLPDLIRDDLAYRFLAQAFLVTLI